MPDQQSVDQDAGEKHDSRTAASHRSENRRGAGAASEG